MSEEQQLWQYIVDGTQLGPVTADQLQHLATSGDISPETFLWTEGLDDWIPASSVEGLFPQGVPAPHKPQLLTGAAPAQVQPVQAAQPVQPAQPQVMPYVAPTVAGVTPAPAVAGAAMAMGAAQPGTEYPPLTVKKASYGLFLWSFLGIIGAFGLCLALALTQAGKAEEEVSSGIMMLVGLLYLGGLLLWPIHMIIAYIYLYRAWFCLRYGNPATTPGKAVGFLFIPFFNLYWIFIGIAGLPKDWNRIMSSYPNLQAGPRMSEGSFLTYAICSLVFPPVAMILHFMIYSDICKGVNFMANRHLAPQAGLAQPTGGIRLY